MPYRARVDKNTTQQRIITACSGREFVDYEWREIPVAIVDECIAHPYLMVAEPSYFQEEADEEILPDKSLDEMTMAELRDVAKFHGVSRYWKLRKADLLAQVKETVDA